MCIERHVEHCTECACELSSCDKVVDCGTDGCTNAIESHDENDLCSRCCDREQRRVDDELRRCEEELATRERELEQERERVAAFAEQERQRLAVEQEKVRSLERDRDDYQEEKEELAVYATRNM